MSRLSTAHVAVSLLLATVYAGGIFSDCTSDTCYDTETGYYGYNCATGGGCERICSTEKCWDSTPGVLSAARLKDLWEGFFADCKAEECQTGDIRGYGCHRVGMCDLVCRGGRCWKPSPQAVLLSGPDREFLRERKTVVFDGCFEEICQKGTTIVGHNCRRGHCDFVCDGDSCKTQTAM